MYVFESLDHFFEFVEKHEKELDNTGFRNFIAYLRAAREGCCNKEAKYEIAESLYTCMEQYILERDILKLKQITQSDQLIFKHHSHTFLTI